MCWFIPFRCFTDYEWEDDELIDAHRFRWNGQAWELQTVRVVSQIFYSNISEGSKNPVAQLLLFTHDGMESELLRGVCYYSFLTWSSKSFLKELYTKAA